MLTQLMLRITLPIFLGSFVLLALGVGAAWYVHHLQAESSAMLERNVEGVRAAQESLLGIRDIRTRLNRFLLTQDRKELNDIPILYAEVMRWLREGEQLAQQPEERAVIAEVRQAGRKFMAEYQRMRLIKLMYFGPALPAHPLGFTLTTAGVQAAEVQAVRRLKDEFLATDFMPLAGEYLDLNQEMALQTSQQNRAIGDWSVLGLVLLGSCGAVAGLLTGYGISRGINSTLVQLSVPIRDAAGKLDRVVGPVTVSAGHTFDDLQNLLERLSGHVGQVVERLTESQRQALRAEQLAAVGQLAAGMAHELRNPLTAMKILVQARTEGSGPAPIGSRDLAVLEEEITRLEQLINTFLDFARPPQAEKRILDLRTAIEPTVDLVSAKAEQVGGQIEVRLPSQPILIEADPGQMRQLVLNLLLNALDALPGSGTVAVQVDMPSAGSSSSTNEVVLRVADTGRGLPDDLGERIFDPFVSKKDTGIGLGLSICRRIVEAHGGRISGRNLESGGAEFCVYLPRSTAAAGLPSVDGKRTQSPPSGQEEIDESPESSTIPQSSLSVS